jgi:hypothetical protein
MNRVHEKLVSLLRDATKKDENAVLQGKTDEQIVRMIFGNFRGRDQSTRGMRLTNFGLQIMKTYFQAYDISRPEGRKIAPLELLYLDRKAKLPYFIKVDGDLVMFDPELGIKLKLADGDIETLIDMDSGYT